MNSEINELIEQFVFGKLNDKELSDFLIEKERSPQLSSEVEFITDMVNSICEADIMKLRSSLQAISHENTSHTFERIDFDLATNLTANTAHDYTRETTTTENSLQKIHIENHLKSMTERVHQINLASNSEKKSILVNSINDFSLWDEIKKAVSEKEVINLRNNLKGITAQGHIDLSDVEIDEYLSNELSAERMDEIGKMITHNQKLSDHIKLHKDIDIAINEPDISQLRNSLSAIIGDEQQVKMLDIERIDNYLLNYLDSTERFNFEEQLSEDSNLAVEFHLNNEINNAIVESDVMKVRSTLSTIIEENQQSSKIRKLIPDHVKGKPIRFIGAAASVAALISAGFLNLNHEDVNAEKLFREAYQPYEATGLFRSVTTTNPAINGVDCYNAHRFDEAISQFTLVLNDNREHPMSNFFMGLCYMEKTQFEKASSYFQNVINEKDNLFIEQAQWYLALSMLGSKNENDAYRLLNQIVNTNGYYHRNAKDLLKKLE
jgi:tetratricopeptide (TPR) repeat protein